MSKAHRGAGLRSQKSSGRGECPLCKKTGIKTVYEVAAGEKKILICKQCKASLASGKKQLSDLSVVA
jgi:ribosomal protein L37AE/L43A